ncbi:tyrosine-type recombinase/integrase [Dyella ginsengisoli]|uniref:tyrosine-type recombinase/integrase n=1 Tax=Dyella ginsengisoli TaxID=363848 RepID=UPI00035E67D5|nr:integrase arm-type DNA-binding domain-containing protein [Dyella ginsengisoli]
MPTRASRRLTDATLRRLVTAGQPAAQSDGEGLTFTVSAGGVASWVLRYRYGGRRRELTLGRYPDLSLADARTAAAKARVQVAEGVDVALAKRRRKQAEALAWSVDQLFRDFEKRVVPKLAPSTAFGLLNYLRTDVLPLLRAQAVQEVTPEDAYTVIDRAARRSYWAGVNARKAGIALFKHAVLKRLILRNPFSAVVMESVAPRPAVRQRVALIDAQMRTFLSHLERLPPRDALLAELLLRTGVRIGEALTAEWADLHEAAGEWRIPRAKIKTRKGMSEPYFAIPLTPAVKRVFDRLRALSEASRWVFPALSGALEDERGMDHERALARLKAYVATLAPFPGISFHDLRSTVRSGMRRLGIPAEVCERALNHRLPGLPGVYDIVHQEQLNAAFEQWNAHLDSLRRSGVVVPLARSVL